jgi:glycosyltransferase involved in cell wall biosynthesis
MSNSPQATRPLRVLHVIDSLGPGGAEHQLATVVSHLRRHGVDSEVAVLQRPYTLKPLFDRLGVTVHAMDHSSGRNFCATSYGLSALLHKRDFDIVHAHLWNSIVAVGLSKIGSRKEKRFVTFHNSVYDSFPVKSLIRRLRKIFDRLLLRFAVDHFVAVSRYIAASNQRLLGISHVEMIFNGLDFAEIPSFTEQEKANIRNELGCASADFLIVTAGRLSEPKGQAVLLDAVGSLTGIKKNIKVIMFGEGSFRPELQNKVSALGLESQVSMPGSVQQSVLFRAMAACDTFAFPSFHEAFGLAAAEAMALGAPVIASAVDGLPELIEDGVSGKLVRVGDAAELATAIAALISDSALRSKYASAAQKRARELFDIELLTGQLAALYRRALGTEAGSVSA